MTVRLQKTKHGAVRKKMWFGLIGTVTIGPGFLHKAGLGRIVLPHPPVVNWLLRRGLTEEARYALSLTHEFGHLQTAPPALLYLAVMAVIAYLHGVPVLSFILVVVSAHAAWEMIAEFFTILADSPSYAKFYEPATIATRVIFWMLAGMLTIIGWIIIFFNGRI